MNHSFANPAPSFNAGGLSRLLLAALLAAGVMMSCDGGGGNADDGGYKMNQSDSHGRNGYDPHYGEKDHCNHCDHK